MAWDQTSRAQVLLASSLPIYLTHYFNVKIIINGHITLLISQVSARNATGKKTRPIVDVRTEAEDEPQPEHRDAGGSRDGALKTISEREHSCAPCPYNAFCNRRC